MNFGEKEKEPEKQNKKNNIINIDDLPIKGVVNYNQNNDNAPEIKQESILNIDDMPIKGFHSDNNLNDVLNLNNDYGKDNLKDIDDGDNNAEKNMRMEMDNFFIFFSNFFISFF